MSYCFMRIEKIKTETSFKNKYNHNFRQDDVPNADPTKAHLNETLIEMQEGKDYYKVYQGKVKNASGYAESRPRKDAVKGIEVMLTYNAREVDESFDESAWKKENVKWLQDTFGKDNVISAVLHKDEATPHIHAVVVPIVDGRLNASHYLGGKGALSNLQTTYGEYMKRVGLQRGLKFSKAEHTDISRYYASVNAVIANELPYPEKDESALEYRERANQIFVDSNLKHLKEMNDKDRKIIEAKTMDFTDKIELEALKSEAPTDMDKRQAQRFREVLKGLERGYFPTQEENEQFKRQMQEISAWERAQETKEAVR